MKKVVKSFPGVKTTVITIAACLVFTVLVAGGFHPEALWGFVLAAGILMMLTGRNYDPDSFEARTNPKGYSYRTERDKLFRSLKSLTEAVEADSSIVAPDVVAVRAAEARNVLDKLSGRYKASAS